MSPSEILSQLIACPSVNPMGGAADSSIAFEARICQLIAGWLEAQQIPCERVEVAPNRPSLFAWLPGNNDRTLWLDAHTDTVPVTGMTIPPFSGESRDGRIHGRGACDVKGGLAAMLHAFFQIHAERRLAETAIGQPTVILSCTCDEEHDTQGIDHLVEIWESTESDAPWKSPPDACIVAEPTGLDVVVAHRGVVRWKMRTQGRACHSSEPRQGISAIYRMARVISSLEEYAASLEAADRRHSLCGNPTLSVGRIAGGESINIVPSNCEIEVERRVVPGEDPAAARREVIDWLEHEISFEVEHAEPWLSSPPLPDTINRELGEVLANISRSVCGRGQQMGVPFGTHASRTAAAGVPSVVIGPGDIAQAHTKDEWIDVTQLDSAAEIYRRFAGGQVMVSPD